ncbi:redox-sensing transcriptional repressor Rex [Marispirochaeta aestuarii]|uniref:Redox-sensing transcriptional repressor Rex n=1 Tax=Marispirochaeta aestuarii TaxID=1963862 RepID=A0A1Y1S1V1_9SPIO|nr:redox-sensing transcriptional repressor Rex [Marispirochaeta aestuarii]ORC36918.1 redox-sensing transcriptional repressor Rex [Marispirochaeta aestuarii]
MKRTLPLPSLERLCGIYGLLDSLPETLGNRVSSRELGRAIGQTAETVRKDIAHMKADIVSAGGYDPAELKGAIASYLGLQEPRRACIAGLGRLGQAILRYPGFQDAGIEICAGFDSDTNKLELLASPVPLLPSYRITEYVQKEKISLGIIAVPPDQAQITADRLTAGGVRGIVNFTVPVSVPETVNMRHVSVLDELRILAALADGADQNIQEK